MEKHLWCEWVLQFSLPPHCCQRWASGLAGPLTRVLIGLCSPKWTTAIASGSNMEPGSLAAFHEDAATSSVGLAAVNANVAAHARPVTEAVPVGGLFVIRGVECLWCTKSQRVLICSQKGPTSRLRDQISELRYALLARTHHVRGIPKWRLPSTAFRYAYTPKLGERPMFAVDVDIDSKMPEIASHRESQRKSRRHGAERAERK
jgi:hypothetical protein